MNSRLRAHQLTPLIRWLLAATALAVLFPLPAASQGSPKPIDLPNGPAKPGFDVTRLRNAGNGTFETFYVTTTEPMRAVLKDGRVAEDTRLLVTDTAKGKLALILDQMAFHHAAQGRAGNKDWFATF